METRASLVITDSTFQTMNPHDERDTASVSVTFVTPLYNPPWWALQECAISVIPQLDNQVDWVIVDDGSSSEEHFPFLDQLDSRSNITIIRSQQNRGISNATNEGISQAAGDFIAFIDQDDLLAREAANYVQTAIAVCT